MSEDDGLKTADYTRMRANAGRGGSIGRCPVCGRKARLCAIPISGGKNAGRVRVTATHVMRYVDHPFARLVRDQEECFYWQDDPTTDTHQTRLKGTDR